MLVRLFGSNYRSLKGNFELSLVAADLTRKEDRDRGVIEVPITGSSEPLRLLRAVAIYGPNASGKSNVINAARALRWLGTDSSERSRPGARIPTYEPFALDEATRTSPIQLGCEVVFEKSLLRYEVAFTAASILAESLVLHDEKRTIELIDRHPSGEVLGELIACSDANRLYVKGMQPNVAVLSKLAQHGPRKGKESALPYYTALRNATRCEDYLVDGVPFHRQDERFVDDPDYREWIMKHLIRAADVGIRDVRTRRESLDAPKGAVEWIENNGDGNAPPGSRVVVSFVHEGRDGSALDFADESAGTRKLFNIARDWWRLANEPGTLLADELSAGLHPRLLDRLIRAVNEARVRSQLVFTSHDTGLLESQDGRPPALRRDQVYFTKKDAEGATELYSLAEFKEDARPVHNIRKRYLSGLYGAIPSVEKLSL